jgi:hypothetical protein
MALSTGNLAILHTVHGAAWLALRFMPPLRAQRTVRRFAGWVARPFSCEADARAGASALRSFGSCLSQSLAVSALLPGSEVVIGARASASAPLRAHAWVELRGISLDPGAEMQDVRRIASLGGTFPGQATRSVV